MKGGIKMKRRQFAPETKVAIVLEGLRGETSIVNVIKNPQ